MIFSHMQVHILSVLLKSRSDNTKLTKTSRCNENREWN